MEREEQIASRYEMQLVDIRRKRETHEQSITIGRRYRSSPLERRGGDSGERRPMGAEVGGACVIPEEREERE